MRRRGCGLSAKLIPPRTGEGDRLEAVEGRERSERRTLAALSPSVSFAATSPIGGGISLSFV